MTLPTIRTYHPVYGWKPNPEVLTAYAREVQQKLDYIGRFQQDGDNTVSELHMAVLEMWDLLRYYIGVEVDTGEKQE
jgi:hypothetical protein